MGLRRSVHILYSSESLERMEQTRDCIHIGYSILRKSEPLGELHFSLWRSIREDAKASVKIVLLL